MLEQLFLLHQSKIFEREGKPENSKEKSLSLLTNFLRLFPIESRESTAPFGIKTFFSTLETTASKNRKKTKKQFPSLGRKPEPKETPLGLIYQQNQHHQP